MNWKIKNIWILVIFVERVILKKDGTQNWIVFQPIHRRIKTASDKSSIILSWKSKWLSDESIKAPIRSTKFLDPLLDFVGTKPRVRFSGDCLNEEKITFNHRKIVNIYIAYEIEKSLNISSYPTLEIVCLVQLN